MAFSTLLSTADLAAHLSDPDWAIVDCRFDLADTGWGEQQYRAAHIRGALYAHLDRDLSGPKTGTNGRHPLPDIDQFKARLGEWGIGPGVQVAAYDQDTGMWASRLWWMLRHLGHEAAAVLDGGLAKWVREGRETRSGEEHRALTVFVGSSRPEMVLIPDDIERWRLDPGHLVVDARAPERYRGEQEPIDPVAGHIPGAVNYFNKNNHNPDGTFLPSERLRAQWLARLGAVPPTKVATYCGSGVAAAHNLLAMEHAGLSGGKLYPGSWSEWCADPKRPLASGQEPAVAPLDSSIIL